MKNLIACSILAWLLVALLVCRSAFPDLFLGIKLHPLLGVVLSFLPLTLVGFVIVGAKQVARLAAHLWSRPEATRHQETTSIRSFNTSRSLEPV